MKRLIFMIGINMLILEAYCQISDTTVYVTADTMSSFQYKNCKDTFGSILNFLKDNLYYPSQYDVTGKVFVRFIIEKDGQLSDFKILRSIDKLYDSLSMELVRKMPAWKPGIRNGQKVRTSFVIPVNWTIYGEEGNLSWKNNRSNRKKTTDSALKKLTRDTLQPPSQACFSCYFEQMPEFPGGETALIKFIKDNTIYPISARKDSIEGKVFVRFLIDKDGYVKNPTIQRSIRWDLDQECIRVVSILPRWKPGKLHGKSVDFTYTIPIKFILKGDSILNKFIPPKLCGDSQGLNLAEKPVDSIELKTKSKSQPYQEYQFFKESIDFQIYPNPVKDIFKIKVPSGLIDKDLNYSIYTLPGQLVAEGKIEDEITEILANNYNSGVYLVIIHSTKFQSKQIKKFIVRK